MIRKAEKKDIPRILELLVQVDMVHHNARPDLFKGPATKYTEEELEVLLQDPLRPVFAAVDGTDTLLGYIFCVHEQIPDDNVRTDIRTLYIDDLCVDEACRGRHIGRQLFNHAVDYARRNGCYNVTLNDWTGNDHARRFYDLCGMKVQKTGMELIL